MLMVTGDWMMIKERVGRRRAVLQARPARDEATTFFFFFLEVVASCASWAPKNHLSSQFFLLHSIVLVQPRLFKSLPLLLGELPLAELLQELLLLPSIRLCLLLFCFFFGRGVG